MGAGRPRACATSLHGPGTQLVKQPPALTSRSLLLVALPNPDRGLTTATDPLEHSSGRGDGFNVSARVIGDQESATGLELTMKLKTRDGDVARGAARQVCCKAQILIDRIGQRTGEFGLARGDGAGSGRVMVDDKRLS